jgi:hypothetical protein
MNLTITEMELQSEKTGEVINLKIAHDMEAESVDSMFVRAVGKWMKITERPTTDGLVRYLRVHFPAKTIMSREELDALDLPHEEGPKRRIL